MDRKTLGGYQIDLKPWRLIWVCNFAKCQVYRLGDIAEQILNRRTNHLVGRISGDL